MSVLTSQYYDRLCVTPSINIRRHFTLFFRYVTCGQVRLSVVTQGLGHVSAYYQVHLCNLMTLTSTQ
jgi:hypothetical protein